MRIDGERVSERQLDTAWAAWARQQDHTYQTLAGHLHKEGVTWDNAWRAADRLLQKKRKAGEVTYIGRRLWRLLK